MKTFITKSKSSLVLIALVALPVWAKPVAQVTGINGPVFVVQPDGKTATLKINDHLEDKSEIMVEEGSSITVNDYYDATYHLIGGTHLKFFDRSAQLKRGKTWIQCMNGRFPLALTTANGHANYWKGEFIATFDQATSRSQFLVVNGDVEVSNVLDRDLKYTVAAGTFTMVDPEVEDGVPRAPTKVGLASLNTAISEFKKVPEINKEPIKVTRSIASVEEAPATKKGEIIFIQTNRLPASVSGNAYKYFSKKVKKESFSHAPIRYFGASLSVKPAPIAIPRAPASVAPMAVSPQKKAVISTDPEFEESLKRKVSEQPKFPKELNSLIEDLKSY